MGELLIVWSARLVVLCYALRIAADLLIFDGPQRERWTRLVWTIGCLIYLVHIILAFHFLHNWSHTAALAHTSRRTYDVVGIDWGGGLYINYGFTLFWIADIVWWWIRAAKNQPTPLVVFWMVHAIFGFMMLNATVVFGPPFWKWIFLAAAILLVSARILIPRDPHLRAATEID